ncbi:unnamed protein product [Diamesa serratosioi]
MLIWFLHNKYNHWKDLGIPSMPVKLLSGNIKGLSKEFHISEFLVKMYGHFKKTGAQIGGLYLSIRPVALIIDLDLVKTILVKDFNVFPNRGFYYNETDDPLSAHLFNIEDERWKVLRNKLTPTFTSGKLKMMFQTVLDVADKLIETLEKESSATGQLEVKDLMSRFTTDVIGSVAFGIECNSLNDKTAKFYEMGTKSFSSLPSLFERFIKSSHKNLALRLHMKTIPEEVADFYMSVTKSTVEYREKNPHVKRQDFMNLLIQMKNSNDSDSLTIEQIAAQSFIFFFAGFETSSTTLTYCLYELSINEEIQERARQHVRDIMEKNGGILNYESLNEMNYLEQCVNETLRKYPPVAMLHRKAFKDYPVPRSNLTIPKGTTSWIPVYAIHHDPEIYPEPTNYDPDRFSPVIVANRHPYAFLPFGEGPRICIGMRFGIMETKIGLAKLLLNYRFTLDRSKTSVPLKISASQIILTPDELIYVNVEKINY